MLQKQRASRHDRLLATVAICPLSGWAQGGDLLRAFRLFPRGVFAGVFHGHQLALALLQTSAMPLGLGRGHLGLWALERFFLLVHLFVGGLQRRFEVFLLALMMPVRTQDGLATMVDLEPAVGHHAFAAELLHRVALAVHPWPLAHV